MSSVNPQGSVQVTYSAPSEAPKKNAPNSPVTAEAAPDEFKKSGESKPSSNASEEAKSTPANKKEDSKKVSELKMGALGAGLATVGSGFLLAVKGATLGRAALPAAAITLSLSALNGLADGALLGWLYNKFQKK